MLKELPSWAECGANRTRLCKPTKKRREMRPLQSRSQRRATQIGKVPCERSVVAWVRFFTQCAFPLFFFFRCSSTIVCSVETAKKQRTRERNTVKEEHHLPLFVSFVRRLLIFCLRIGWVGFSFVCKYSMRAIQSPSSRGTGFQKGCPAAASHAPFQVPPLLSA